jgi:hypothetical protein
MAEQIKLYPGVDTWFDRMNQYVADRSEGMNRPGFSGDSVN